MADIGLGTKIRRLYLCKVRDKHVFVQNLNEDYFTPGVVRICYECKLCGKKVYQEFGVSGGEKEI